MELPDPPQGWTLKALLTTDETWTAQLWAEEEYVYGYGTTPRFAILDALTRIESGDTYLRLSGMTKEKVDLIKALGIGKPATFVRRA